MTTSALAILIGLVVCGGVIILVALAVAITDIIEDHRAEMKWHEETNQD